MPTFLSTSKGFIHLYLILGLVIVLILAGIFFLGKLDLAKQEKTTVLANVIEVTPTPTPSPWKTYKNDQYKFSFDYPRLGMITGENDYVQGECGKAITESGDSGKKLIRVDNFFDIKIISHTGTIEEYLKSIGAFSQYDLELVSNSLADEAVKIIGLKKGAEYAVGYPPLVYVSHIYKKGDNLFLIIKPQAGGNLNSNKGGCINPEFLDPVKHAHLKEVYGNWDFSTTFKFN